MAKVISLKCPECGSNSLYDGDNSFCFCQHCGTKIFLEVGKHTTHTYHKYDEGRIKEAEVKETIRLREIELEEAKFLAKERTRKMKTKASIILGVICAFSFVIAYTFMSFENDALTAVSTGTLIIGLICVWGLIALNFSEENENKDE